MSCPFSLMRRNLLMRGLTRVLLALVLCAGVLGCSSDSESMTNSTEPSPPPAQVENQGAPPSRTQSGDKDTEAFSTMKPPGTDEAPSPE
jgi:hypothetical protein